MDAAAAVTVTRWWWIRHAPVVGPPGLIAGRSDPPADLSDAPALARLAARLPPGAVWLCSRLRRSRDTAFALVQDGTRPEPVDAMAEQDFGAWDGMTHAALAEDPAHAAEVARFWRDPALSVPPGGESFAALSDRVAAAVDALSARHAGRDIVAVAHGGPIRAALGLALGLTPERMLAVCVDCLHLTRLDHVETGGDAGGVWRVVGVNIPP